jgi:gamma-butyrobetaine dioxygenase
MAQRMDFQLNEISLIINNKKLEYELPYLWIRDNCPCNDCRVEETLEKKFMLNSVPADLKPKRVDVDENDINICWPDDHETIISFKDIQFLKKPRKPTKELWTKDFIPKYYNWDDFLQRNDIAIDAISDFIKKGAIIIKNAPSIPNSLEELAPRLGPIREVLFERIHNVSVDVHVYNIAHTSLELPPHNDFASYTWPPSVQALHMLKNECEGGKSIIVDGYAVLRDLRNDYPNFFDILSTFSVPFREFDEENETYAIEPIIRLNAANEIIGFRYSNQLMQMIDPNKKNVNLFYKAYHELCNRINSEKYKSKFRLEAGQILLVSAHRVLHGREKFEPNGKRHLQDAYFEMDNIENNLVLYKNLRE